MQRLEIKDTLENIANDLRVFLTLQCLWGLGVKNTK